MKKLIIIITILFLSLNTYCQNYIPLVDTNSVWNITFNCYPPPPYPCYTEYYRYHIGGDTLFNDTVYIKLYQVDMNKYCSSIIFDSVFVGGIREDVVDKKVYYNEMDGWGESLLYDFGLEVGDTVPMTYNNYGYPEIYVSAIDSVQCTDGFRKRFVYSRDTWPDIDVIEGIGAYTGLLEPMQIFEYSSNMRCYYYNDTMIYMNPFVSSCNLEMDTCISTETSEFKSPTEKVIGFPNPASNRFNIEIINPKVKYSVYIFRIYDIWGNLLHKSSYNKNKYTINIKKYKPGVYYYIVNSRNKKLYSGVFIKN